MAGVVKGLTIRALNQYDILSTLKTSLSDKACTYTLRMQHA